MAAPDDGGDAPKSTIQVLSPASQLAETTVIVFFKNNVFLLVNLNVQFPPGNDINVPSCPAQCVQGRRGTCGAPRQKPVL